MKIRDITKRKGCMTAIIIVVVLIILSCIFGETDDTATTSTPEPTATAEVTLEPTEEPTEEPKSEPTPEPTPAPTAKPIAAPTQAPTAPPAETIETAAAAPEEQEYTLRFGELLSVTKNTYDNIIVVKAKITPSYSNKSTIDQNYYNIEDLVKNQGVTEFGELQYWAVADMTSGNESKVISFTVSAATMDALKNDRIVANQLGDYVDDLWVHQSLR